MASIRYLFSVKRYDVPGSTCGDDFSAEPNRLNPVSGVHEEKPVNNEQCGNIAGLVDGLQALLGTIAFADTHPDEPHAAFKPLDIKLREREPGLFEGTVVFGNPQATINTIPAMADVVSLESARQVYAYINAVEWGTFDKWRGVLVTFTLGG